MTQGQDDRVEVKRQLRHAFGAFATGVTVVTTTAPDGSQIGFTANSFTSVSLDPPLLLVCLANSSSNFDSFANAGAFAVSVLGESQKDISSRFASRIDDRFAGIPWHNSPSGVPLIDEAIAWFDCTTHKVVDAGDHAILIGRIQDFGHNEKRPLAYLRGHYLDLGLTENLADSVSHSGGLRVGCVLEHLGQVLLRASPNGWTLPLGELQPGFRQARSCLNRMLEQHGIPAEVGFLYSVFDAPSGNATWMIFQGEIEQTALPDGYRLFALDSLPFDDIEVREFRSILSRFRAEFHEARFGLYVDNPDQSGRINPIDRASTNWSNFMKEQAQ